VSLREGVCSSIKVDAGISFNVDPPLVVFCIAPPDLIGPRPLERWSAQRMKLVVFGLTVSSSWGNGYATLWRGLIKALVRPGIA
jgi:hypothetical protein